MLKRNHKSTTEANNLKKQPIHLFQLDWLGQMTASILWAASVLVYGVNSTGDVLQLCAALSWMIANIAAFTRTLSKENPHLGQTNQR